MTKFIIVASGKGGVGKTTTAINLGTALNRFGRDVIVVDGNLTTPNIGLYLGVSKVPVTLHDSLNGKSVLNAIYRHASGLKVVPGDISITALSKLDAKNLKNALQKLNGASEIVIIDSAAGFYKDNLNLMGLADEILIITTPDLTSVTDSLKTVRFAEAKNVTILGIVLNKVRGDNLELSAENVETILDNPIIAVIPESNDVREAQAAKHPVVYTNPNSDVSKEFKRLATRLIDKEHRR